MPLEDALDYATGTADPLASAPGDPGEPLPPGRGPLTPRQREIAALVARGRTNHEIAEDLVITERTVEAHITQIRRKLNLRSRVRIATWVAGQGRLTKEPRPPG